MNRIVSAARLHLVAPWLPLLLPWAIMASSLAINILIWGVADIAEQTGGRAGTGGLASLYITLCVVYMQAVSSLLPFAMGLSLTRRTFYLGTSLFAVGQSFASGLLLYAFLLIERGTGGWGVGLKFFRGFWLVDNAVLQVVIFAVPMLAVAFLGMAVGAVYKRFGSVGVYALTIGAILGLGGSVALITWQNGWPGVGAWFTDQSILALLAGWPLLLALLFAAGGYAGLRRVVP